MGTKALVQGHLVDLPGHLDLPLLGHGHSLTVDGEADQGGSVEAAELKNPEGLGAAVFQVDGVDDATAGQVLQSPLHRFGTGAVNHDRKGDVTVQEGGEALHEEGLVLSGRGEGEVHEVGLVPLLLLSEGEHPLEIFLEEGFPKGLASRGVGPFSDQERLGVGVDPLGGEEGAQRGRNGGGLPGGNPLEGLGEGADVVGSGSATAAGKGEARGESGLSHLSAELLRGERIDGLPLSNLREAGVGHQEEGPGPEFRQLGQRGEEAVRPEAAVEPQGLHGERLQGGGYGGRIAPCEGSAGQVKGEGDQEGAGEPEFVHGLEGPPQGRLGLKKVLAGLDQKGVHLTPQESQGLAPVALLQEGGGDLPQRGEKGARSHGPDDPTLPGRVPDGASGDEGRLLVDLFGPFFQAVLGQDVGRSAEGVCLDQPGAGFDILLVDPKHRIRSAEIENLRTGGVAGPGLRGKVHPLQGGAHGAVEEEDSVGGERKEGDHGMTPFFWSFAKTSERAPAFPMV